MIPQYLIDQVHALAPAASEQALHVKKKRRSYNTVWEVDPYEEGLSIVRFVVYSCLEPDHRY